MPAGVKLYEIRVYQSKTISYNMETEKTARHDLITTINYYDDPGDGSTPMPVYVGK